MLGQSGLPQQLLHIGLAQHLTFASVFAVFARLTVSVVDGRGVGAACPTARFHRTGNLAPVEIPIEGESLLNAQLHEKVGQVSVVGLFFETKSFAVVEVLIEDLWTAATQYTGRNRHLPLQYFGVLFLLSVPPGALPR